MHMKWSRVVQGHVSESSADLEAQQPCEMGEVNDPSVYLGLARFVEVSIGSAFLGRKLNLFCLPSTQS